MHKNDFSNLSLDQRVATYSNNKKIFFFFFFFNGYFDFERLTCTSGLSASKLF